MEQQFDTSKIGMWLFLATEVLLFGGLFVGFGMMQARYPQEFMEAHEHLQRPLGALNTVVLLISSFTMVMGVHSAKKGDRKKLVMFLMHDHHLRLHLPLRQVFRVFAQVRGGLAAGPVVSGAGDRYRSQRAGHASHGYATFFSFYFMMTGLHGIHILVGIVLLSWIAVRGQSRRVFERLLHAGRPGGPVLAPGRHDLDLPVPAVLPDQMSTHTEHASQPASAHAARSRQALICGR